MGIVKVKDMEVSIMELKDFNTCDLVEELSKREGVKRVNIGPEENSKKLHIGPMIVLEIID